MASVVASAPALADEPPATPDAPAVAILKPADELRSADQESRAELPRPPIEVEPEPPVGRHCADQPGTRLVWHQLLVGRVNPGGIEHSGRFGICTPFIEEPGMLFDRTNAEVGLVHQLAPAYGHLGGYLQLTPLSFLVLRAELSALTYWPFPFNRAGYFPVESYDAQHDPDVLLADDADNATGLNANLVAIPRVRVPIGPIALIGLSVFAYEYWAVGDEDYYVNIRREMVLAREDGMITNEGMLMVEIPLTEGGFNLRVGAYDAVAYGVGSAKLSNGVGGLLMVNWPEIHPDVRQLTPFVRLGAYSHHPFRAEQFQLYAGLLSTFDFGALPERIE